MKKNIDVARAWRDEDYYLSLTEEERASLGDHPAGAVAVADDILTSITRAAAAQATRPPLSLFATTLPAEKRSTAINLLSPDTGGSHRPCPLKKMGKELRMDHHSLFELPRLVQGPDPGRAGHGAAPGARPSIAGDEALADWRLARWRGQEPFPERRLLRPPPRSQTD